MKQKKIDFTFKILHIHIRIKYINHKRLKKIFNKLQKYHYNERGGVGDMPFSCKWCR